MNERRPHTELLGDLVKRNALAMNAQRRIEVEIVCFVRFFAAEKAPQRAERLRFIFVRHNHLPITLSSASSGMPFGYRNSTCAPAQHSREITGYSGTLASVCATTHAFRCRPAPGGLPPTARV